MLFAVLNEPLKLFFIHMSMNVITWKRKQIKHQRERAKLINSTDNFFLKKEKTTFFRLVMNNLNQNVSIL